MYLYRGINDRDYELWRSNKDILCNLTRNDLKNKNIEKIKSEVFRGDLSLSLDRIIGHVSGLNMKQSCWISSSSDYNHVLREYCIPQCGKYNTDPQRKNIIVINADKDKEITEDVDREAKNVSDYNSHYIDLSNNNLSKYVNNGFICPISINKKSYNYNGNNKYIPKITGFNNFAYGSSEHLFLNSIKKEDIKYIITPLMQDIIYAYTYKIEDSSLIENIIDNLMKYELLIQENINNNVYNFNDEEMKLINYLYIEKNNKYNNVIDLVIKNYDNTHDIVNDYEVLKDIKRNILSKITELNTITLVDDSIYVINDTLNNKGILVNNRKINQRNKYDIIYTTDKYGKLHNGYSKIKK